LWIKLADRGLSPVEVTLARLALGAAVLIFTPVDHGGRADLSRCAGMPGRLGQLRGQLHLHGQVPGPPGVAAAVTEFLTGPLLDNPQRVGKPLARELAGYHSARRGAYRVVYRIDEPARTVHVVRIEPGLAALACGSSSLTGGAAAAGTCSVKTRPGLPSPAPNCPATGSRGSRPQSSFAADLLARLLFELSSSRSAVAARGPRR